MALQAYASRAACRLREIMAASSRSAAAGSSFAMVGFPEVYMVAAPPRRLVAIEQAC
ncbi:MAG: hypothetical protein JNL87_05870 [Burkholderiaceae bacterium]|nr:hypothetical protein [Burkholderiaceae bacterium]